MKKIIALFVMLLGISYTSAASCTDLATNLYRFQESSGVYRMQQFLFDKGYLKATPNGYFGLQTFAAVKKFQVAYSLSPVGSVGPMTRSVIKKASCGPNATNSTPSTTTPKPTNNTGTVTTVPVTPSTPTVPVTPVIPTTGLVQYPNTPSGIRNAKRRDDITAILKALYAHFNESRGVHAVIVSDVPIELCANTKPLTATVSVSNGSSSDVVVTEKSPCADYVDIADLVPRFMQSVPHDPQVTTTSALTGYTITRSATNDIVIAAKSPEDDAIIQATCNFNGFCKSIQYISTKIFGRPEITTINRSIILRDATPRTPLIIKGRNFTGKNTVKLFSLYNSKEYILGQFNAVKYTATSTAISVEGSALNQDFSCGVKCTQKLPLGDYMLSVINEGGESNTLRFVVRGFTTSSMSTQVNGPVIPMSKNIKVGTITLASTIPVTLKSLTLTSTSTSKNLASKIINMTLKDSSDGSTFSESGSEISFGDVGLYENQSKVYDVFIDTDEVLVGEAGFITYGGMFLISDNFGYVQMEIPIKEFSFSVSH